MYAVRIVVTLAQQYVLALVSMVAQAVQVVVVVAVVLHVMEANHIITAEAASPGAQAAQVHAKDAAVVVEVDVHVIVAADAATGVGVVVVVTVVTHAQMDVHQGAVIQLE